MKLLLVFFFAILAPFFVFITEVLYGGTRIEHLKASLVQSNVYTKISSVITNIDAEEDPATKEVSGLIYGRFTPEYVQNKTEKLIDDSHIWITADGPSPIIEFSDIKDDLIASDSRYDILFAELSSQSEQIPAEDYATETAVDEYSQNPVMQGEADSFTNLAKNNFVVPVGEYFAGIKAFYSAIKILQPIIAVILVAILLLLFKVTSPWKSRFRWIGSAFITASVFGFGMVLFNQVALTNLLQVNQNSTENFLTAFSPIILTLMDTFMKSYATFQNSVSMLLGICGLILLVVSFILKTPTIKTTTVQTRVSK
jgi:hypothetical protein